MKKILLFTAILFASITMGNAQNAKPDYQEKGHNNVQQGEKATASTNLTIVLNPIQSISVNTSNVSLVYTTVSDYKNGVSSGFIPEHIEVYSTGGYKVNVGFAFPYDSYSDVIALDAKAMFESVNVVITTNETNLNVNNTKLQPLKTDNGSIISSNKGVFGAKFNVDYQGDKDYMNNIKNNNQRTYIAYITYTITPS